MAYYILNNMNLDDTRVGSVTSYDLDELHDYASYLEGNGKFVQISVSGSDEVIYETEVTPDQSYYTMRVLGHADFPIAQDYDLDTLMGFAKRHEANGHTVVITDHCGEVYRTAEEFDMPPITGHQRQSIPHLLRTRDLSAEQRPKYAARLYELVAQVLQEPTATDIDGMTQEQAQALMSTLLALPYAHRNTWAQR